MFLLMGLLTLVLMREVEGWEGEEFLPCFVMGLKGWEAGNVVRPLMSSLTHFSFQRITYVMRHELVHVI